MEAERVWEMHCVIWRVHRETFKGDNCRVAAIGDFIYELCKRSVGAVVTIRHRERRYTASSNLP